RRTHGAEYRCQLVCVFRCSNPNCARSPLPKASQLQEVEIQPLCEVELLHGTLLQPIHILCHERRPRLERYQVMAINVAGNAQNVPFCKYFVLRIRGVAGFPSPQPNRRNVERVLKTQRSSPCACTAKHERLCTESVDRPIPEDVAPVAWVIHG